MMLAICAAVYGAIAAMVFRRFTDRTRMRVAVNHMLAHIMEFALFIDEPRLILKAQVDLIKGNFRLLRRIALPCVLLGIPFLLLYPGMDRQFGARISNVLTLPTGQALPVGVVAETPAVRIPRTHEISWRIRPSATPRTNLLGLHWTVWFGLVSLVAAAVQSLALRAEDGLTS
jgi:hypothetical protein